MPLTKPQRQAMNWLLAGFDLEIGTQVHPGTAKALVRLGLAVRESHRKTDGTDSDPYITLKEKTES